MGAPRRGAPRGVQEPGPGETEGKGGRDGWMNGWGEINQAGGLMNGSYLYRHTTITTGWLVGWFLLVLLWLMSICPTSLVPSSHSLAELMQEREIDRFTACSLQPLLFDKLAAKRSSQCV